MIPDLGQESEQDFELDYLQQLQQESKRLREQRDRQDNENTWRIKVSRRPSERFKLLSYRKLQNRWISNYYIAWDSSCIEIPEDKHLSVIRSKIAPFELCSQTVQIEGLE